MATKAKNHVATGLAARLLRDPRFKRPPKAVSKVAVDARFQRMFTDSSFSSEGTVDKYGRRVAQKGVGESLKRLYRQEEEDEEEDEDADVGNEDVEEEEEEESEEDEKDDEEDEEDEEATKYDPMRGEGVSSSSSEDEYHDELDSDAEQDLTEFEQRTLDRIDVPVGEQTNRLAVINLDWDHVRAQDLLQLLDSFKPASGSITSVTIYPSQFGKERLQYEEQHGPPKQIFKKTAVEADESEERDAGIKHTLGDAKKDISQVELRKYQVERLRYFYAVVVCDSVATATSLYANCDGLEYENSANMIDMRFIPDEETFDDEPRDAATNVIVSYEPIPFETKALQHTNADLTWDEDDPARVRMTRRKFTKDDLKNMDFNAYLASDSDEDADDEEADDEEINVAAEVPKPPKKLSREERRAKYRALLNDIIPREEPAQEMEITFTSGLADVASGLLKKKKKKNEAAEKTVWESYLDKRKEKRKEKKLEKARKAEAAAAPDEDGSDIGEDNDHDDAFEGVDDDEPVLPKVKVSKKAKKNADAAAEEKRKAELDLLLMDEQGSSGKHFHLRQLVKEEKLKDKKKKSKSSDKDDKDVGATDKNFAVDVNDTRFTAVYDSHLFAIDPSAPQYKKTKGMKAIIEERQKRIQVDRNTAAPVERNGKPKAQTESGIKPAKETSLSQLVASIKRKNADSATTISKGKRSKNA